MMSRSMSSIVGGVARPGRLLRFTCSTTGLGTIFDSVARERLDIQILAELDYRGHPPEERAMSTEAVPGSAAAPSGARPSGVFSRSASGLIRVAGSWDVFIFNVGLVSVGIAIAFNQYYGPSMYPCDQPAISTQLAALGM